MVAYISILFNRLGRPHSTREQPEIQVTSIYVHLAIFQDATTTLVF